MKKDILLEYIWTDQQVADIFTKSLPNAKFSYLHNILSLVYLN